MCSVIQSFPALCDPMDCTCQAPLSMEFPRQEHWSGLLLTPPENLPSPRIEPVFPALAGGFFTTEPTGKPSVLDSFTVITIFPFPTYISGFVLL